MVRNLNKILLLNPPTGSGNEGSLSGFVPEFMGVYPPTGLCYIASFMRKHGYYTSILDSEALGFGVKETIDWIVKYNPDVLGITCKSFWISDVHKIAKEVKRILPNVTIVVGGNHITSLPEKSAHDFPSFDILVVGEGEITFYELIESINNKEDIKNVPGLVFKENDKVVNTGTRERISDLDILPFPSYDLLPELKSHYYPVFNYACGLPAASVVFSRGCPHQCGFCSKKTWGRQITHHSPEYFVDLIEMLKNKHAIKFIVFDDDNLLINKDTLFAILDLMEKRNLRMPFSLETRVDTIDLDRIRRLKKAGCKKIMYGIESGSQKMLDMMNKKITLDQVRYAIELTKRYKIDTLGFFMLGFPGETESTMKETVNFIKELRLLDIVVSSFLPLPGSTIYDKVSESGVFNKNWNEGDCVNTASYIPHGLSQKTLNDYIEECYDVCYKRWYQYVFAYRRIHSFQHLKLMIKYLMMSKKK